MKAKLVYIKIPVFTVLAMLLITSCGRELQLYEWETMDLMLLNTETRDTLANNAEIEASKFSILVNLNAENVVSLGSSDWLTYSNGFQANDVIESIEIISSEDYNDVFPTGELLNDVFYASFINEPETSLPLDEFIERFGSESGRIESGFELIPNIVGEGAPREGIRTFTVTLELEKSGTFQKTTDNVSIY